MKGKILYHWLLVVILFCLILVKKTGFQDISEVE
jgi:hypothetical protein